MDLRAGFSWVVIGALASSGCLVVERGASVGLAAPLVAKKRQPLRPTTKKKLKKRKPTKRKPTKRRKIRPDTKKKPGPPPPSDPPPAEPPPAVTCGDSECGVLVGVTAAHNQARADVGVAPLEWDRALHEHATAWAQQLAENGCHPLSHQQNTPYGENLYWNSHGGTAQGAVTAWTAEKAHYDAQNNTCASGKICGHYTQVVWAASTRIGCGVATCGQERVWVCEYDPRGNYLGQRPY